jgi:hypothetical protein
VAPKNLFAKQPRREVPHEAFCESMLAGKLWLQLDEISTRSLTRVAPTMTQSGSADATAAV